MLSQQSFDVVAELFHNISGIRMSASKHALVEGRLQRLANERSCSIEEYVQDLLRNRDDQELVHLVDALTTNETYFFREPQHFDFLAELIRKRPKAAGELRIWSAASSSGEEAYSIAMLLADKMGLHGWRVIGTDLSTAMVETGRRGLYTLERARLTPEAYLKRWCLKGHSQYEGHLLICKELRERVSFESANLTQELPDIGHFDVIFLRNVLIYFDPPGKAGIVRRVLTRLKPEGYLLCGHAESINNLKLPVSSVGTAVYVHA